MRYAGFEWPNIANTRFGSLIPVVKVALEPLHALLDILQGIGIGKAKIAFTVFAKINSGADADMGFFKNVESQFIGVARNMLGIGNDVKGAGGFYRNAESQLF